MDTKQKQAKNIFDMVYMWGKVGMVVDEKCNTFEAALDDYVEIAEGDKMIISGIAECQCPSESMTMIGKTGKEEYTMTVGSDHQGIRNQELHQCKDCKTVTIK